VGQRAAVAGDARLLATPLEIFLYDWWPIRAQRRLYERLRRMTVRVVHAVGGLGAGEVEQDAADTRTEPSEDRTLRSV
jgi:hypothetical protein